MESKADLLLHPVRMRLVLSLANSRPLTATQLGSMLADVPQATLYRHINKLVKGGVLNIVEQRPVRGTIEKVYALAAGGTTISPQEADKLTPDDHMRHFVTFIASLLGDYERYLQGDKVNLVKDGVGYHQVPVYLSDTELAEMAQQLNQVMMRFLPNQPSPGRKRRVFTSILMPAQEPQGETEDNRET